jgi:hypothetical protein
MGKDPGIWPEYGIAQMNCWRGVEWWKHVSEHGRVYKHDEEFDFLLWTMGVVLWLLCGRQSQPHRHWNLCSLENSLPACSTKCTPLPTCYFKKQYPAFSLVQLAFRVSQALSNRRCLA